MEILQENGRKGRGKQIHRSKTFTRKCCHEMLRNCQILAMKNRKHEKKGGGGERELNEAFTSLRKSSERNDETSDAEN